MKKTSEYYLESAKYWLGKMGDDVENKDLASLRLHLKDMNEAFSIARLGRKHGD